MAVIFGLTFISVFLLAAYFLTIPFSPRARVRNSLGQLAVYEVAGGLKETQEDTTFMERIGRPLLERLTKAARQMNNNERLESTRLKLSQAGIRNISAEKYEAIKLGFFGAALIAYVVVVLPWSLLAGTPFWYGLVLVAAGYFLPDFWLNRRVESRQKKIAVDLADAIDILTIAIEAGLAFDGALTKVARNMDGPLSEEFGRVLGELQIGVSRAEALRTLGDRTTVEDLQNFCATLIQADALGISISKILKTEASEIRLRRKQFAEEQAMKIPVKIVFPVILCILPALMIVIIGPGIIRIAGSLIGMGR